MRNKKSFSWLHICSDVIGSVGAHIYIDIEYVTVQAQAMTMAPRHVDIEC
jgi:hypothetical protein